MSKLAGLYESSAESAGVEPDSALLSTIEAGFQDPEQEQIEAL